MCELNGNYNIFETRAEFYRVRQSKLRHRGGGLFLHDNIGFAAVVQLPIRLQFVGFWISGVIAFIAL